MKQSNVTICSDWIVPVARMAADIVCTAPQTKIQAFFLEPHMGTESATIPQMNLMFQGIYITVVNSCVSCGCSIM